MSLFEWDYSAPTPSSLGDHDVPLAYPLEALRRGRVFLGRGRLQKVRCLLRHEPRKDLQLCSRGGVLFGLAVCV